MRSSECDLAPRVPESAPHALDGVRAEGGIDVTLRRTARGTSPRHVAEGGGYRAIFPRVTTAAEAVIVNTGGGIAGGDRIRQRIALEAGAEAIATTPSAERIYRSHGPEARITIDIEAAEAARLLWLPQETILYSGARLSRTITAHLAADSTLLLAEIAVFGRTAMGETLGRGLFADSWRIYRAGRLAFAEAIRLDGDMGEALARPTVAGGARVALTLLWLAPAAEDHLEACRESLAALGLNAAASAWNGLLVVRALGDRAEPIRRAVGHLASTLAGHGLPRVWGH